MFLIWWINRKSMVTVSNVTCGYHSLALIYQLSKTMALTTFTLRPTIKFCVLGNSLKNVIKYMVWFEDFEDFFKRFFGAKLINIYFLYFDKKVPKILRKKSLGVRCLLGRVRLPETRNFFVGLSMLAEICRLTVTCIQFAPKQDLMNIWVSMIISKTWKLICKNGISWGDQEEM